MIARYLIACGGAQWAAETYVMVVAHDRDPLVQWDVVVDPERVDFKLSGAAYRYTFALNWNHRVSAAQLAQSEWVNFHCTRLPEGRGGAPIENLIIGGHTETVITAHRMTEELDAGPIYGVSEPISLAGTKAEIQARFRAPVARLIYWIVDTEPTPTPQVGTPTYFKRLSPAAYQEFWRARG